VWISKLPTRFSPRSCRAVSSALKLIISNVSPKDFMMSSSIEPDVVTRMFGICSLHNCAKKPRSPDVTMLDVNVRNIFAPDLFIFMTTFAASESSTAWYPRLPNESTISSTVMPGFHLKSLTFFIVIVEIYRVVTRNLVIQNWDCQCCTHNFTTDWGFKKIRVELFS